MNHSPQIILETFVYTCKSTGSTYMRIGSKLMLPLHWSRVVCWCLQLGMYLCMCMYMYIVGQCLLIELLFIRKQSCLCLQWISLSLCNFQFFNLSRVSFPVVSVSRELQSARGVLPSHTGALLALHTALCILGLDFLSSYVVMYMNMCMCIRIFFGSCWNFKAISPSWSGRGDHGVARVSRPTTSNKIVTWPLLGCIRPCSSCIPNRVMYL